MQKTLRLELPLLATGQAQKEVTHNEALILVDALVHGICAGSPTNDPPTEPEIGVTYLCGSSPRDSWTTKAYHAATWTEGGWRFNRPYEGLRFQDRSEGFDWTYDGGTWRAGQVNAKDIRINGIKVVGPQRPSIEAPVGGDHLDEEARAAIVGILDLLRGHGLMA